MNASHRIGQRSQSSVLSEITKHWDPIGKPFEVVIISWFEWKKNDSLEIDYDLVTDGNTMKCRLSTFTHDDMLPTAQHQ